MMKLTNKKGAKCVKCDLPHFVDDLLYSWSIYLVCTSEVHDEVFHDRGNHGSVQQSIH